MKNLVLYTGPNCKLCELAKNEIWPILGDKLALQEVDITSDVELLRKYRLNIPVLHMQGLDDLFWPFGQQDIKHWLGESE